MPTTGLAGNLKSRLSNILLGKPASPTLGPTKTRTTWFSTVEIAFGTPQTVTPSGSSLTYGVNPGVYTPVGQPAQNALYGLGLGGWVDVTKDVRSIAIRRGRSHELDRTQAGTLDLRLRNTSRAYDPSNTSSPYYPNVVPMVAVRVSQTIGAVEYPVFYGYVEDFKQIWPNRTLANVGNAECQVTASDGFAALSLFDIGANLYSQQVLQDQPALYFRLADPAGTYSATNEGSVTMTNMNSVYPATFGYNVVVPLTGGQSTLQLYGATDPRGLGYLRATTPDASLKTMDAITLEAWVRLDTGAIGSGGGDVIMGNDCWRLSVVAPRKVQFKQQPFIGASTTAQLVETVTGATTLSLDTWHHIVGVRDPQSTQLRVYLDGKLDGTAHYTKGRVDLQTLTAVSIGADSLPPVQYFSGEIAHAAVYLAALDALRIAAHASCTADSFAPQSAGSAISKALDGALWPSDARDIDTGSNLVAHDPASSALEECLVDGEDSDRGLFFISSSGKATFRSRQTLHGTGYLTPLGTFGDDVTEIAYSDLELGNDDLNLWNTVTVTRTNGGPQTASDQASQIQYGPRSLSVTAGLEDSELVASDLANALLLRYKAPHTRPQTLTLLGAYTDPPLTAMAATELGTRITVRRRPPGGGPPLTMDATVEGITHDISPAQPWVTTWNLVPAEQAYWVMEDPTYGVLDTSTAVGY